MVVMQCIRCIVAGRRWCFRWRNFIWINGQDWSVPDLSGPNNGRALAIPVSTHSIITIARFTVDFLSHLSKTRTIALFSVHNWRFNPRESRAEVLLAPNLLLLLACHANAYRNRRSSDWHPPLLQTEPAPLPGQVSIQFVPTRIVTSD
jgi:hypothetical protein